MKNKIGFDIGACIGETIPLFEGFDEIYAFEPSPYTFNTLSEKCSNDPRIKCFQIAISDENSFKKFHCHDHYGYSSLLGIYKEGELAKICHEGDFGFDEILSVVEVQTKRLDTFMQENCIENVHFIKIDTQGNDLNVIKSLGEMISKVDIIEAEVQMIPLYENSNSREEFINFMQENNFNLILEEENGLSMWEYERKLTFERSDIQK